MELILIRHGESEGNANGKLYGHTDYPLTQKGRSQIPHIVKALSAYKMDKVISSPLVRAKAIGDGVSEAYGLPIMEDDRLKEIHFGKYEDIPRSEVIDEIGEEGYVRIVSFLDSYEIPEGEHQDAFLARVHHFTDELLASEDGSYVITAHYGVLKAMLNHLLGYTKKQLRGMAIKPGAVVKLTVKKDRVRLDELIQTYDKV